MVDNLGYSDLEERGRREEGDWEEEWGLGLGYGAGFAMREDVETVNARYA